jgi:hypothetical protein
MTMSMHGTAPAANRGPAQSCGGFAVRGGWLSRVMRVVHSAWKEKKAANLAACMGSKTRAAEYVLGGRAPSSDGLVNLLRSDELGPQLLDALLGDVDWYQQRRNLQRIGEAEAITRAALQEHLELKSKIGRHRR